MTIDTGALFGAIRTIKGSGLTQSEVDSINAILNSKAAPSGARRVSSDGIRMMHHFEGCRLTAYPDPGSKDGHPWTIGYGATGAGIGPGVVWTQRQVDERFEVDLARFSQRVDALIAGVPTSQAQYDALVGIAYNIGVQALAGSTLLKLHRAGDHKGAADQFLRWNKNDGRVMAGLTRRREAERARYLA